MPSPLPSPPPPASAADASRPKLWAEMGAAFLAGLLALSPVAATVFVVYLLLEWVGSPAKAMLFPTLAPELRNDFWVGLALNAASVAIVALLIMGLGRLTRHFLGRWLVEQIGRLLLAVPLVNTVYLTFKQVTDTLSQNAGSSGREAVLVEFPRPGVWSVGFVTGGTDDAPAAVAGTRAVFIPMAPNPTMGYVIYAPASAIRPLGWSMGEAMKFIISAGAVAGDRDETSAASPPSASPSPPPRTSAPATGSPR